MLPITYPSSTDAQASGKGPSGGEVLCHCHHRRHIPDIAMHWEHEKRVEASHEAEAQAGNQAVGGQEGREVCA